jgi:hypothetical protein
MLMALPEVDSFTRAHIALAKLLLQRGADVNGRSMGDGFSAIHCCLDGIRNSEDPHCSLLRELLGIYMAAGADLTAKTSKGYAPLGMALECNSWCGFDGTKPRSAFETVKLLLRHGAPIDACLQERDPTHYLGEFSVTAEAILRRTEAQDRHRAMPYNLAADEYLSRARRSSPTSARQGERGNSTSSTCRRHCSASGRSLREGAPGASSASARGRRVKSNYSSRRRFRTSSAGECSSTGTRATRRDERRRRGLCNVETR